jgi:poly(3-hydroxybutyrate) depolymerase
VEGELDDISGAGQTRAAHDLCTGIAAEARQHIEVQGAGHYGIFSGSRWRKTVYPQVRDFILAHQPASATAASAAGHLSSVSDDGAELESNEAHADKSAKTAKTGQNSAPAQKGRGPTAPGRKGSPDQNELIHVRSLFASSTGCEH